jgi:hypothetical protein
MSGEVQQHIQKFLFHLSNQDHAAADDELKQVIDIKHQERFDAAYEEIKESTGIQDQQKHKLVNWINQHEGVHAVFKDNKLYVTGKVRMPDGNIKDETQVIPPTLKAARDWLGY